MRVLHDVAAKLRGLLKNRGEDPEFEAEVREHLRLLTERLIQSGMTPEDAVAAAQRQFGNASLLQENRRDMRTYPRVENLWRAVRFGVRQLRLSPAFTATALLSLA